MLDTFKSVIQTVSLEPMLAQEDKNGKALGPWPWWMQQLNMFAPCTGLQGAQHR